MTQKAEPVSLVIRAWNEAKQFGHLLESVRIQDYTGEIELIVVDNGSTDDTIMAAKLAGATIVHLKQSSFSYPRSLNVGIQAATHELVVEVVAHALPIGKHWLSNGVKHFQNPKVAGVYGGVRAVPGASLAEKIQYCWYWVDRMRGAQAVRRVSMGVMGATNIIIRRSVWQEQPFDERYGMGGEDEAWARWALAAGWMIIHDPGFAVYHSHGLRFAGAVKQHHFWRSLKQPRTFDQSVLRAFRADLTYRNKQTESHAVKP